MRPISAAILCAARARERARFSLTGSRRMLLPFTINPSEDPAPGDPPSDPPPSNPHLTRRASSAPPSTPPSSGPRSSSPSSAPPTPRTDEPLLLSLTESVRPPALPESDATLRAVFDASPLAIVALDADVRVTLWNRAAERLFGWRAIEALGRKPSPEFMALCGRALLGETITSIDATQLKKDATPVRVRVSIAPLPTANGAGVVAIFGEVT